MSDGNSYRQQPSAKGWKFVLAFVTIKHKRNYHTKNLFKIFF